MAGSIADLVAAIGTRFSNNVSTSFSSLSAQQWIRLIAVAGAYILMRPYIIKIGGKVQMKQHEAEAEAAEAEAAAIAAGEIPALSANDLRGGVNSSKPSGMVIPDSDDDESGDEATTSGATGADWGKTARKRQRRMLRKMLEAHEQKLADAQADEEDKEIQEFLVD